MTVKTLLDGDHTHVLLDALGELQRNADALAPWAGYDGEEDPKASREGYLALLAQAVDALTHAMDTSGAVTVDTSA